MGKGIVDKKSSVQVRIDRGIHNLLEVRAKETGKTIKSLVEAFIADGLGPINPGREK